VTSPLVALGAVGETPSAAVWRRRGADDVAIACALWAIAFVVGGSYSRLYTRVGGVADFGQHEFSAAVALACGKGFVNLDYAATPGLARFLSREADAVSCAELSGVAGGELNVTQRLYRYLMSAAALVWRLRGVSWSALWPLFGVLFATVIAAAYGVFRLGAGRVIAAAAALALVVSSLHLGHLPYLRDYAKAPFMLSLVLVMGLAATGALSLRRMLAYAALFGLVLGIGFGFRNDLLINVPPFLAVVFLCTPGRITANLRVKLATVAVAALVFTVSAWPILRGYSGGSNTGHVALLGLMTPFDASLGIRPAIYDWGYAYVDQFAASLVSSYSVRVDRQYSEFMSPAYDRAAMSYLLQVARHWPADIVVRAYASTLKILEMPFAIGAWAYAVPYGATAAWVRALYDWQVWLLGYLSGHGTLIAAAALLLVASQSVWTAVVLLGLLIYYAGYPAIQFGARHFFHLEFIGWCALAFVAQAVASLAARAARRDLVRAGQAAAWWIGGGRVAAFAILAVALVVAPLAALRGYQSRHVRTLVGGYGAATLVPLHPATVETASAVRIVDAGLWDPLPGETPSVPVRTRYFVVDFTAGADCDAVQLPVRFRYWYEDKTSDLSREVVLRFVPGERVRLFFPAFFNHAWWINGGRAAFHFDAIELPRAHAGCMTALSRIADPDRFGVLLDLTLADDWQQSALYQTIAAVEQPRRGAGPRLYTIPADLVLTRSGVERQVRPIAPALAARARIVTPAASGWIARGRPDTSDAPLLQFGARAVPAHSVLIAEGELRAGRVSFSVRGGGQRPVTISVGDLGPFLVAVEAPAAGAYAVTVANDIDAWWPASKIGHRVGPLVEWIPGATLRTDAVVTRIGWWTGAADQPAERPSF
jgi:hypothetical protein